MTAEWRDINRLKIAMRAAIRGFLFSLGCALWLSLTSVSAWAQSWPQKPVRFVVPYPPGGGADMLSRILAQTLTEGLEQPLIIENKPGGGTQIGTELAAKAAPDGYTVLLVSPSFTNNVFLYDKLAYDVERDFQAVTLIASVPLVLVVPTSLPAMNITELIQLAHTQGNMNYAIATGSSPHLAGEMLKLMGGFEALPVPYRGMAPAYPDLMSGRIQFLFDALTTALPNIRAGKTRAIGVSSAKRSSVAPDIPTLAETGVLGFVADGWFGLVVPKGTPSDIIKRLNAATLLALNDPVTRAKVNQAGFDLIGVGPEEFTAFMKSDAARWGKLIKQVGIKGE